MKHFLVTIDTERDCSPDWSTSDPCTFNSVLSGIPDILQPVFARFGVRPTYLLSSEVIEEPSCVSALKALGDSCELGTHLHGEFVEPGRKYARLEGVATKDFSCFYDEETEYRKLETITNLFEQAFGRRPRSFRAGRFGAGPSTLRSLEKLGYAADTSVTPGVDNVSDQGVCRFASAPVQPYYPDSAQSIAMRGNCAVLEVPVSIRPRIARQPVWLRPFWISPKAMLGVLDHLEKRIRGNLFANMMFHSMEVIPGASPYCQTNDDVRRLLQDITAVFEEAKRRGYRFIVLGETPGLVSMRKSR